MTRFHVYLRTTNQISMPGNGTILIETASAFADHRGMKTGIDTLLALSAPRPDEALRPDDAPAMAREDAVTYLNRVLSAPAVGPLPALNAAAAQINGASATVKPQPTPAPIRALKDEGSIGGT